MGDQIKKDKMYETFSKYWKGKNEKKILVRTPEAKRTLGRSRHKHRRTVKKEGVRM